MKVLRENLKDGAGSDGMKLSMNVECQKIKSLSRQLFICVVSLFEVPRSQASMHLPCLVHSGVALSHPVDFQDASRGSQGPSSLKKKKKKSCYNGPSQRSEWRLTRREDGFDFHARFKIRKCRLPQRRSTDLRESNHHQV